ncbi:alpha/beta hydrolase [Streptomyces sp. NPDC046925]|uniref:alpha/beta hydrolase n=1 Tax=Streptomyces sp. NPDC046925 TaxID=3155375 RepID=UPI0033F8B1BE
MVNSLHDPASGYNWATNVAAQLGRNAVLHTYRGWGHGTYSSSPCAQGTIDDYLISTELPVHGASCPPVEPPPGPMRRAGPGYRRAMSAEESADHVAVCPITPPLVEQVVALAQLPLGDWAVSEAEMRRLGWCDGDDDLPLEDTLVTAEGHLAYLGDALALSFAHFYWAGGEAWEEDFWGTLPGWTSRVDAGRDIFDTHIDAAIAAFTRRLGPPERDITAHGGTLAMGEGAWRHAAWRCGDNLLVIGPRHEALSYYQFEEAVIYIGPIEKASPLPALADFVS